MSRVDVEALLPMVQKPSRYLGTEVNAVHKRLDGLDLRLALVFPDLYDLGLGNLGLHILYAILNRLDGVYAERAYAPAPDLEALLRERDLPLFTNESKTPLSELDGIGFTLQSELTYTNILNVLDLAGLPLRSADRDEGHPLTFAGGPAVFNPEPLAPFLDFFVIGDGEDVVVELAELLVAHREASRREKLLAVSRLEGVYVPALYPMERLPDGRILPALGGPKIRKRTTAQLDGGSFPVDYIVPFTEQVHDRVSLEVLRGCTQGCRFCQAGMTTRPVRERTVGQIEDLMRRTLDATGYEEVSLVSLSTCDHSRSQGLVDRAAAVAAEDKVSVSLPSLRLDSFSVGLADKVADVRRTGLTFAPEAASPRLRALINKWIPDEDLLEMSGQAFDRGWKHVKLYFMIGLPTERDDDVEAIADLTLRTVEAGRARNPKARVNTGVSTFVPKPFTPFQWAEQIDRDEAHRRQGILKERFRGHGGVKFGRHEPDETFLEGLVSRADRRAADLIEAAWENGARFDAWSEHRDVAAWERAIEETGFDVDDALRQRGLDERLPWDHLDVHIPKEWLRADWEAALRLEHAPDCRHSQCHRCGVIDVERELCASMLRNAIAGAKEEGTWTPRHRDSADPLSRRATTAPLIERARGERVTDPLDRGDPEPVCKLRFRVGRVDEARLLGHLEAMKAWIRALRRAKAPLAYTQGFHQHPRVSFSAANPLGEASVGDLMDVVLVERVEPGELLERLQATLPAGFVASAVVEVPLRAKSLMSQLAGARYRLGVSEPTALRRRVEELLAAEELLVERKAKRKKRRRGQKTRTVDVRPMLAGLAVDDDGIVLETRVVGGRSLHWREVLRMLDRDPLHTPVLKERTWLRPGEPVP